MRAMSEEEILELRNRILSMARKAEAEKDPLGWFEDLYESSDGDESMIPWSSGEPNQFLIDWMRSISPNGKALVVGSGLGEDAAHLAKIGWDVTAFDLSPTAIEWSSNIYDYLGIHWRVENLLDLPDEWVGHWDLVVEVHILQAIPEGIRNPASKKLAPLLAPGGKLICIGRYESSNEYSEGPPWPLAEPFIHSIGEGLNQIHFEVKSLDQDEAGLLRYISVWNRQV
tara:strand:- start:7171 stop:7851 length:681 start_codon:yes stop_codon:yes gene_type:complete